MYQVVILLNTALSGAKSLNVPS